MTKFRFSLHLINVIPNTSLSDEKKNENNKNISKEHPFKCNYFLTFQRDRYSWGFIRLLNNKNNNKIK